MNFKHKCFYMALGCLFTLIGYTLATLNNDDPPSDAIFDQITCRALLITHEEVDPTFLVPGEMSTFLSPGGLSFKGLQRTVSISDSGIIVAKESGVPEVGALASATLTTLSSGGALWLRGKSDPAASIMGVDNKGSGFILLQDPQKKEKESGILGLNFDEYGGQISIFNKGKNVLQAGVHNRGGGFINTRDKNGYLTGRLP